jgi:hypothetical protein
MGPIPSMGLDFSFAVNNYSLVYGSDSYSLE